MSRPAPCLLLIALSFLLAVPCRAATPPAEEPHIDWVKGPKTVDLGNDVAQVDVPEGYIFANADDARKLLELQGNPPSGREMGILAPGGGKHGWFLIFEYSSVGYVRDDEKDKIDADALLKNIREGTEEANKVRREKGWATLSVVGWSEPPHYDAATHNLVWAIEARDSRGEIVVNYNVRLLGRRGYTSVVLVTDPDRLATNRPQFSAVLSGFSYKPGGRYAEFVSGDKVAEFGLAALVAGGAGAAAVKLGLFSKLAKLLVGAWKLVVAGIAALIAAIKRMLGLGGKKSEEDAPITP